MAKFFFYLYFISYLYLICISIRKERFCWSI